jgi:hypothetical protein
LKELRDTYNPAKKAKIIGQAKDLISQSIDDFWRGLSIHTDNLTLDADQLVTIVTYTVIKGKISDLPGQIKLIEEFTSPSVQNSKLGQALFTLRMATDNVA